MSAYRLQVDGPAGHGFEGVVLGLAGRQIQFGVAQIADAGSEAEAEQMHECEHTVGAAGRVSVMLLDPQIGFVVKQPIEDVGGVPRTDVDDLRTERRVLIGDMGIEKLARLGSIFGVDMAGTFSVASGSKTLPVRGRRCSISPLLRKGLLALGVDEFRECRGIGIVSNMPGLRPGEFRIA